MPTSAPTRVLGLSSIMLVFLLAQGSTCGTTIDTVDAGDGPEEQQTCESVDECPDPANYDCLGVCLQRCAADAVCKLNEFCSARGYCEVGCRDSSTCSDEEVCVGGTCQNADAVGSCGDKCDCQLGQVCLSGVCQDPPPTCGGPDDCGNAGTDRCNAYACNGFTQQCFDPDPPPCSDANDCIGRPECSGVDGCICNASSQCVPGGDCTTANEADVCGPGFYCDDTGTPRCEVLPACGSEGDCTAAGLTCNLGTATCERAAPCTLSSQCTQAPATYCAIPANATDGGCEIPTCLNGGVTCQATEQCTNDGRCLPMGTGVSCNSDADCPNDVWPNTQYCQFSGSAGECTPGCRSNASCTSGDVCNGVRQCVADGGNNGGGGDQAGAPCDEPPSDPDCAAGLVCSFYGTCDELCETPGPCAGNANCCPLTGYPNCEAGLVVNFCRQ